LVDALFKGIDRFLPRLFADPAKAPVAEKRLQKLLLHEDVGRRDPRFKGFLHGL
jgi:hypothetical protein